MTNHPRQREMWEGLTGTGCLTLLALLIIITLVSEFLK